MQVFCRRPLPRQQFFKAILGVILDPSQDVCQIDLRIMAMLFGRLDDGQDIRDALATLVGAGEEPVLSANSNAPFILPMSAMKSRSIIAGIRISARGFPFAA
ncbi:hypothetical protein BC363_29320 [Ensifer sp. LC384]|nr:hypothetical protein BC363_29320 [Ensifer sp. LC384]